MAEKPYKIDNVKHEERGVFSPEHRQTVRDSAGKVAVGDWKDTRSESERSARERLSSPDPKKK